VTNWKNRRAAPGNNLAGGAELSAGQARGESVVVGIRTPEQMADNLKTTEWGNDTDEISRLDKLSKPAPVYPYDFKRITRRSN